MKKIWETKGKNMPNSMLHTLESRTLFTATPLPALFDAAVLADRVAVRIDLLHFEADILAGSARLLADRKALKTAAPRGDTSLVAPFAQLAADNKTMQATLKADRLTESANALADESVIKLDILQIKKDKGNATAEAAAQTKLTNDRITLQTALIAGLDSRIATRTADAATITNDVNAIVTAADNDPAATQAFAAKAAVFAAQSTAILDKLTADLATITAARTKLVADLTAEI
jgi:hypothetical protein